MEGDWNGSKEECDMTKWENDKFIYYQCYIMSYRLNPMP